MKQSTLAIVLFGFFATRLLADYSEPFTDSPIGKTVTAAGWLIADSDGKSGYAVVVTTDTGHRVLFATVSTNLNVQPLLGRRVIITATIGENRRLSITDIALPPQAKAKAK
jgi:hypothetical protein